jgi:DNA-binding MarR family transcriptional regulator
MSTPPPRSLAVLLRDPFLALTAELTARLAERGHPEVRPAHGSVFGFLDDAGTRLGMLAERAQVTRQSMAELVRHLERHGYVELVPDPGDRRARLVRPTDRGRAVWADARAFMAEVEGRWAATLGERGLRDLRRLLERIQPG